MAHLIIKQDRPYQIMVAVILLTIMVSTTIWFLLDESHWAFIKSRVAMGQETRRLWEVNRKLEQENKHLNEQIVMLERSTQIDNQAAADLHEEMKRLQDEIYKLKEELVFYQGIVTSAVSSEGLKIQSLRIVELPEKRNYHFKLILTHITKDDIVAEGMIEILLEGVQDGTVRELDISDVVVSTALDLSFKFRNFKRVVGEMALPEGFTPRQVIIRLQPKDPKLSVVRRVFNWSEILG
ncbi:MAG: DUF6776 family protein [Gammaproteobacteria bacterium]